MSTVEPAPPFRNRQGGLIFFGIVEVLFGLGAGAIALLIAATMLVQRPDGAAMPVQSVAAAVPTYVIFSVVFLILGIGSMMARRWARALTLALSWMWLITGVLTGVAMVAMSGTFLDAMPAGQAGAKGFVIGCMVVMLTLFGVVVPLILISFYASPNVRATVESIDRVPRWTDRVPIPVLVFALWMLLGGISMFVWSFVYPSIPVGSWIVTRPGSTLIMLFFAVLSIFIAIGSMRLKRFAWWTAMAMVVFGLAYALVLLPRTNLVTWFESSGMAVDPRSAEIVRSLYSGPSFWIWMGVLWIGYFAFLLSIRRYFFARETNRGVMSGAAG